MGVWADSTERDLTFKVGCKAESWRAEVVMSLCLHANLLLYSAQQHCPPAPSSLPTLVPPGWLRRRHRTFTWWPRRRWPWSYSFFPPSLKLFPWVIKCSHISLLFPLSLLLNLSQLPELYIDLPFLPGRRPFQTRTTLTSWRTPWTCRPSSGSWTRGNTRSRGSI